MTSRSRKWNSVGKYCYLHDLVSDFPPLTLQVSRCVTIIIIHEVLELWLNKIYRSENVCRLQLFNNFLVSSDPWSQLWQKRYFLLEMLKIILIIQTTDWQRYGCFLTDEYCQPPIHTSLSQLSGKCCVMLIPISQC